MVRSASEGGSLEGDAGTASSAISSATMVHDPPKPASSSSGIAAAEIHCCDDWRRSAPLVAELDRSPWPAA
jgi:hypothetical protein